MQTEGSNSKPRQSIRIAGCDRKRCHEQPKDANQLAGRDGQNVRLASKMARREDRILRNFSRAGRLRMPECETVAQTQSAAQKNRPRPDPQTSSPLDQGASKLQVWEPPLYTHRPPNLSYSLRSAYALTSTTARKSLLAGSPYAYASSSFVFMLVIVAPTDCVCSFLFEAL